MALAKAPLGGLSATQFLTEYWQKKPLLIRQGLPADFCDIDENDLAGLAMEPEVESRLIWETLEGKPWQLESGPFSEEKLQTLPSAGWTLLIQGLDQWSLDIMSLLDRFRFLPAWRLDDIMASFAPAGGSVGPHYDNYDVFLIQAKGRRRWQVGPACDENSARVRGTPLRILENMPVEEEWILEPGDILYLPPQLAHHGVALENGITLSVGFRAPTWDEMLPDLLGHWIADPAVEKPAFSHDYADSGKPLELDPRIVAEARNWLVEKVRSAQFGEWLGTFLSEPKQDHTVQPPEEALVPSRQAMGQLLAMPEMVLFRNEGSRFLLSAVDTSQQHLEVYVDGKVYRLPETLRPAVERLSENSMVEALTLSPWRQNPQFVQWLCDLIRAGSLQSPLAD